MLKGKSLIMYDLRGMWAREGTTSGGISMTASWWWLFPLVWAAWLLTVLLLLWLIIREEWGWWWRPPTTANVLLLLATWAARVAVWWLRLKEDDMEAMVPMDDAMDEMEDDAWAMGGINPFILRYCSRSCWFGICYTNSRRCKLEKLIVLLRLCCQKVVFRKDRWQQI